MQNTKYKIHTGPAVLIRPSLRYKTEVSQKTSYWDTELQIWVLQSKWKYLRPSKSSKGGKEARLEEGKERQKGWTYRCFLTPANAQVLQDFSLSFYDGGTGTWPYQRPDTRPDPEFKFSAHWRWSGSHTQIKLRPFKPTPVSRTRTEEKKGRIGEVEKRK